MRHLGDHPVWLIFVRIVLATYNADYKDRPAISREIAEAELSHLCSEKTTERLANTALRVVAWMEHFSDDPEMK
jgi:hypothetical protein